jgi:uncharacterized protein with HEPN domain
MKSRHYHQSLRDILDAAEDIEKFMAGVSPERLTDDRLTLLPRGATFPLL